MELRHFLSSGVTHYTIPAGGPGLHWAAGVLRGMAGVEAVEHVGLDSVALEVRRGGDRVVLHADPMAEAICLLHPDGKTGLFREVVRVLSEELGRWQPPAAPPVWRGR